MKKQEIINRPADIAPYTSYKPKMVPVCQFGLDGKYIKTFESISQASQETKATSPGIWLCINGRSKSSGGFQWKKA